MNNKLIIATLTTFLSGTLFADTEMTVKLKNGEVKTFEVCEVSEINFVTETPVVDEYDSPLEFLFFTSSRTCTVNSVKQVPSDSCIIVPAKVRHSGKVYDVTMAGKIAFHDHKNLKNVYFPESVTRIGDQAFMYCENLETVTLPKKMETIYSQVFANCYNLSNINIPDSLKTIWDQAFYGCRSLSTIDLPLSLNTIGETVFKSCRLLTKVNISSNVTSIGIGAFADCQSLQELSVAEDNMYYSSEDDVLYDKAKTTIYCVAARHQGEYVVNSDVKSIEQFAFNGCVNLTSVVLPENLTSINNYTFMDCSKLTNIEIPSTVTKIGNYAFYNCSELTTITIPSSVTSIGSYAFGNCKNLNVIIDNSKDAVTIDKNAFYKFTSIRYLK